MATISSYEGNNTVEKALQTARGLLKTFVTSEGFLDNLTQSFGDSFNFDLMRPLVEGWAAGEFGTLPKLEIRSAAEINGANGAYASSTNRVYLSSEFLSQSADNPGAVTSVLLEEIGHYLDSHVNTIDPSGDEGAIFSTLVQGQSLALQQLQLLRGENDSATVAMDGHTVAIEQAQGYMGTNIRSVIDGMDGFLTNLDTALNNQIFANSSLPLVGNQLKNTQQIIKNFQDDIKAKLQEAISTGNGTVDQVREALFRTLGPSGFKFLRDANGNGTVDLGDIAVTETANDVLFSLQFRQIAAALNSSTQIKFNTGLPELELDVPGNVTPKLGFDFNLNFGVNSGGFYVNTAAADELKLNLDVTTPGFLKAKGKLGPLELEVNNSSNPTQFNGSFAVNLKGGIGNKLTTFSELDLDAILTGSAKINLATTTTFNGAEFLPELKSDLNINWGFDNSPADLRRYTSANFGLAPTVAFNNVRLDLESFFNKFAGRVLGDIDKITKPIQPIAKILTTPIDLGLDKPFKLLDIAKVFSQTVGSTDLAFLDDVVRIASLITAASKLKGEVNLGNFNLSGQNVPDVRTTSFNLSTATPNPTAAAVLGPASTFINDQVKGFTGLRFPILDNQQVAFKLLLGNYQKEPLDLLRYNMPALDFGAEYSQFFPIIGPLGAEIKGEVKAQINLGFGFDTKGLGAFLGSTAPSKPIYDGFFVSDFAKKPEVKLSAGLLAFASANLGVASAGVGGGIFGDINFDLNDDLHDPDPPDPNNDPDKKIRFSELESFLDDPIGNFSCLFDTSGELTAGLRAYIKALTYTKNFDSPRVTLLTFNSPAGECKGNKVAPNLATSIDGKLRLNTGPNALGQLGVSPGGSSGGGGTPEPGSEITTQWIRQLGSVDDEYSEGVAVDGSGSIYTTGTEGVSGDPTGAYVAKYGSSGNQLWIKQLGASVFESNGVAVDGSGNAYVTGATSVSPIQGYLDAWIVKYNSSGNQVWRQQLGTSDYDTSSGVAVDGSGNAYITGSTSGNLGGPNQGREDAWVAKYNSSGNQLWVKQLGTSSHDYSSEVAVDSSGNVYITGHTSGGNLGGPNQGSDDVWVAKYNSSGNQLWVKQLGTSSHDYSTDVAVDSSGNAYVTGLTAGNLGGPNQGIYDAWVAKYNSSGNQVWRQQLGTSDWDTSSGVAVDNSGNVYITGSTSGNLRGPNQGSDDAWVAKYNSSGNQLWVKQLGTSDYDTSGGVAVDGSQQIYLAGTTDGSFGGPNQGNSDAWVGKFSQSATSQSQPVTSGSALAQKSSLKPASLKVPTASPLASNIALGNIPGEALDLGPLTGIYTFDGSVNSTNTADYYRFEVKAREQQPSDPEPPGKVSVGLLLNGLDADADVQLLDSSGNVLKPSTLGGTQQESIDTALEAGFYYVRVLPYQSANTKYKLTLAVTNQDEFFTITKKAGTDDVYVSRDQFGGSAAIDRSVYGQTAPGVITQEFSAGSGIEADGGEGNDTFEVALNVLTPVELNGGTGHDLLRGGSSNDVLEGDDGNDSINGRVGRDTLRGGTGNDLLEGRQDADILDGGDGSDTASYSASALGVSINLATRVARGNLSTNTDADGDTLDSIENITGSQKADILIGDTVGNILSGQEDNDVISGDSGRDILSGGAGIDTLTGGIGNDTFVFESKTEGKDTLTDFVVADDTIQVLKAGFGGGLTAGKAITAAQFRIGAAAVDASDRFIYNKNTGALFFDVDGINGAAPVQFAQLPTGLAMTNADIFVVGDQGEINLPLTDFNGDGQTDILYRNRATGQNAVWLMNETNLNQVLSITPLANLDWNVGSAGDFNGDDQIDILWRNGTTGKNVVWLMGETDLDQAVSVNPLPNLDWSIGGTGDFNDDDQTDILWRNEATGENAVWLMNGTKLVKGILTNPLTNLDWSIGGAGDFNGDDQTDILWRNEATGQNAVWLMNGTTLDQAVSVNPLPNLDWSIGGAGDFNGDDQTDILWHNEATGQNAVWLMNGTTLNTSILTNLPNSLNSSIGA